VKEEEECVRRTDSSRQGVGGEGRVLEEEEEIQTI
jgi:hypothetical protein